MLKLKKIAVTGGLAAGKTTVCRIFEELGAYVVSADEIVHQLLLSSESAISQQVIRILGSDILSENKLDRRKIAAKVFSRPELLQTLEELIHPAVFDEIEKKYRQALQEKKYPLFVVEVPLLFESEREKHFDVVIAVIADPQLCKVRFGRQSDVQEFEKRMTRQIPQQTKAKRADYIIENNGDLQDLKNRTKTIYLQLTESDFQ